MENQLIVTVTKTSNGLMDYIQIMSDDSVSVNIVLIADKITVADYREKFDSLREEKEKEMTMPKTYTLRRLKKLKEEEYDEETAGLIDHADHFDRAEDFLDWLEKKEKE